MQAQANTFLYCGTVHVTVSGLQGLRVKSAAVSNIYIYGILMSISVLMKHTWTLA
jgi:hypothetical protein